MSPAERAKAAGWVRHHVVGGEAWWNDARGRRAVSYSWRALAWVTAAGVLRETEDAALAAALNAAGVP